MSESIEKRLAQIEEILSDIKIRNQRVSNDKAWETSLTRRLMIAVLTYVFAYVVFRAIGVGEALLNAIIPTIGYVVSTFSVPWVKRLWLQWRE